MPVISPEPEWPEHKDRNLVEEYDVAVSLQTAALRREHEATLPRSTSEWEYAGLEDDE